MTNLNRWEKRKVKTLHVTAVKPYTKCHKLLATGCGGGNNYLWSLLVDLWWHCESPPSPLASLACWRHHTWVHCLHQSLHSSLFWACPEILPFCFSSGRLLKGTEQPFSLLHWCFLSVADQNRSSMHHMQELSVLILVLLLSWQLVVHHTLFFACSRGKK